MKTQLIIAPRRKDTINEQHMKMQVEEASIAEAIRLAEDRIGHFHVNAYHRCFLGTGSISWVEGGRVLKDFNYTGPISLELFRRNDDRSGLPIAHWRPPHQDETERLPASVSFLSSHLVLADYRFRIATVLT